MSYSSGLCLSPHQSAHLQILQASIEVAELPVRDYGHVGNRIEPERSVDAGVEVGFEAKSEVRSDEHSGGALKQLDSCDINRPHHSPHPHLQLSNHDPTRASTLSDSFEARLRAHSLEKASSCTIQTSAHKTLVKNREEEGSLIASSEEKEKEEGDQKKEDQKKDFSPKLEPNQAADMCCATRIPPSQRKLIKRKASVFSLDGFPNIQLLDQQHVKAHNEVPQQEKAASSTGELAGRAAAVISQARRSVRLDMLGSTGSSRASSCDEPTNAAPAAATPLSANTNSVVASRRKASAGSITNVSPSSTCSLDSTGWTAAPEEPRLARRHTTNEKQALFINNTSAINAPTGSSKTSAPFVPFESIKTHLKQNSIPNAQTIQRHIDNLISQNEQIVDNWNLISIRSYTSSRQEASTSKRFGENLDDANIRPNMEKQAPSNVSPTQTQTTTPTMSVRQQNKRWSTAMLANMYPNYNNNIELPPKTSATTTTGYSNVKSQTLTATDSSRGLLSAASNFRLKQHERKRSYNLSRRPSIENLIEPSGQLKQHSPSVPSSPKLALVDAQKYLSSQLEQRQLSDAYRLSLQEPAQLESAIQNLSIKRNDEESKFNSSAPITMDYNLDQSHQDLMLNQYQHDERLLMSLLTERHRLSLLAGQQQRESDLEKQNEILRQQQMIERQQQLELFRLNQLAATIELQQHCNGEPKDRVTSLPAFLTPLHQHDLGLGVGYLREQQALESQLLKDFLYRMAPHRHHYEQPPMHQQINMEHGCEMTTQSLDSAMPLHRCYTCDISFWTRDLLNYHHMTQCAGRQSSSGERPPVSFSFGSHLNNFEQNPHHHHKTLPESVAPPTRREETMISESDCDLANGGVHLAANISILKQQLLTSATAVPLGSLPFKKRKISEPNMRC